MDAQKRTISQHYRLKDICRILGISKSKIYEDIGKRLFPAPIKLGRTSVWSEDQLSEFMAKMANQ
jgi:predicted DNA-binding transcriptional regulator AlpA